MTAAAGPAPDWRAWLLIASAVAFAVAAALVPAMPQPPSYHGFVDARTFWSVPNFLNVASNLAFLAAGATGLAVLGRGGGDFIARREALPYYVFFLGALLTCFGSAWYHLAPDNARLVWDRLPMTLGFSGLVSAAIAERSSPVAGARILWPLLVLGAGTVFYWDATERAGAGNVLPYGAFQVWSIVAIVLLLVLFPAQRYSHGGLLGWAAGWYFLAKLFEAVDAQVFDWSGGAVSGHTLKHLFAAVAVFAIARQLHLRRAVAAPPDKL